MSRARSLFNKIFFNKEKPPKNVTKYVEPPKTINLVNGKINTVNEMIFKLVNLVFSEENPSYENDGLASYINTLSTMDLIPYGENVVKTIESISGLDFQFVSQLVEGEKLQYYCLIREHYDATPIAIYKITKDSEQYHTFHRFCLKAEYSMKPNVIATYAYRHICGIIYNHVKEKLIKLPLPDDPNNFTYLICDYPEDTLLIEFDDTKW